MISAVSHTHNGQPHIPHDHPPPSWWWWYVGHSLLHRRKKNADMLIMSVYYSYHKVTRFGTNKIYCREWLQKEIYEEVHFFYYDCVCAGSLLCVLTNESYNFDRDFFPRLVYHKKGREEYKKDLHISHVIIVKTLATHVLLLSFSRESKASCKLQTFKWRV